MKKLFFIRHMHGKYVGANKWRGDVDFEKARIFSRRSDATLAMKAGGLDDLYSIFVLEISDAGMKHSAVKPLPKGELKSVPLVKSSYFQGIRSPEENEIEPRQTEVDLDDVLPELNLRSHEALNPTSISVSDVGSLGKFSADECGTYIPSYALENDEITISPDLNKVKDTAGNEVRPWRERF